MKHLIVVQRFGAEVRGGAEVHARGLAHALAARGHDVDVLTSCALRYTDWADELSPGRNADGPVVVHRLPAAATRDEARFALLTRRVLQGRGTPPWHLQEEWLRRQGPHLAGLDHWLDTHGPQYDVAHGFTYLYEPTVRMFDRLSGRVPTVFHPTAHDEPPLRLDRLAASFRLADAFCFNTPEERALIGRTFGIDPPGVFAGVGVDPADRPDGEAIVVARARFGLGDRPYVLAIGRIDPSKGTDVLIEQFTAIRRRRADGPVLVLVGDPAHSFTIPPDAASHIVLAGLVDDATKQALLAGSLALVQPSPYESFGIVLLEAWDAGVPVVVNGRNGVLRAQVSRAGGGLAYGGVAELDAALGWLGSDAALRARLAASGRRFVDDGYRWPEVAARVEQAVTLAQQGFATRGADRARRTGGGGES